MSNEDFNTVSRFDRALDRAENLREENLERIPATPEADSSSAAPSDALKWDYATLGLPNEEVAEMWRASGHSGVTPFSFANRIQERLQLAAPSPTDESMSAQFPAKPPTQSYIWSRWCNTRGAVRELRMARGPDPDWKIEPMYSAAQLDAYVLADRAALATPRQPEDGGGLSEASGEVLWRYQHRSADGWFTQYEADEPAPSSDTRNIVKFVLASTFAPKQPASAVQGGVPEGWRDTVIDAMGAIRLKNYGLADEKLRRLLAAAPAPTGSSK